MHFQPSFPFCQCLPPPAPLTGALPYILYILQILRFLHILSIFRSLATLPFLSLLQTLQHLDVYWTCCTTFVRHYAACCASPSIMLEAESPH